MSLTISCSLLKQLTSDIFIRAGVPTADAAAMAEVLTVTDMRGIHSHGVVRSARYIDCIRAGGIRPDAEIAVETSGPAFLQVSAAGGLGIPAAVKSVNRLIELGRRQPLALVTVNHSDHFGAAGYYTMLCAEAGLIGFAMSNTCPLMAPTGGAKAAIGNNPFAWAAPAGRYRAALFDICMSTVACGKVEIAAAEHKTIPPGWLLDRNGVPTQDPDEYAKGGIMTPFGAHKGYGLAVMVEMLSGALAGAAMLSGVHSWNTRPGSDSGTGHCFITINPEFFGGLEAFVCRMEAMIAELLAVPAAPGGDRVRYPGEIEFERERHAAETGIALPEASLSELRRAAAMTGLEPAFQAMVGGSV